MRWFLGLVLGFGFVALASAEVPQQLHYNGYLTNAAGEGVNCPDPIQCDESFELSFRIYNSQDSGSPIWTELEVDVPIYNGSFHVVLGDGSALDASILNGESWVGVKVNDHAEMDPRQKVLSAAYAIRAGTVDNAESLNGMNAEDFVSVSSLADLQATVEANDNDALAQLACTAGQVPKWDGSAWVCTEDLDTQLGEAEVDAFVTNNGYASNLDLSALQESLNSLDSQVTALEMSSSALICSVGQVTKWNGSFWACAEDIDTTIPDTNTQLSEAEVDVMVANNGYANSLDLIALQDTLTTLQSQLASLETTTSADLSGIQAQIVTLQSSLAALESDLSTESSARVTKDLELESAQSTEATERAAEDLLLQGNIDLVGANLTALEGSISLVGQSGNYADLIGIPADSDTLLTLSCSEDEIPKFNGASWVCAASSAGTTLTTEPAGACGPSTIGAMHLDLEAGELIVCNGTSSIRFKGCGSCPVAAEVLCGFPVLNGCGEECGEFGSSFNLNQCPDPATVACGQTSSDDCGNPCPGTGSGLNVSQCADPSTIACGLTIEDGCGNDCGSVGNCPIGFPYSGVEKTFVVPEGVTEIFVKAWGAGGGSNDSNSGGAGGHAQGGITVSPGEILKVQVGQKGSAAPVTTYGGGGSAHQATASCKNRSGGGRSAILRGGADLIVAGGGGGAGQSSGGGAGGGTTGQQSGGGAYVTSHAAGQAGGGSQSGGGQGVNNGGSAYWGGNSPHCHAGGGGGGYYGGGAGSGNNNWDTGGGGGSSYVSGLTGGLTVAGSNNECGNSSDPDFLAGTCGPGEHGFIVITY